MEKGSTEPCALFCGEEDWPLESEDPWACSLNFASWSPNLLILSPNLPGSHPCGCGWIFCSQRWGKFQCNSGISLWSSDVLVLTPFWSSTPSLPGIYVNISAVNINKLVIINQWLMYVESFQVSKPWFYTWTLSHSPSGAGWPLCCEHSWFLTSELPCACISSPWCPGSDVWSQWHVKTFVFTYAWGLQNDHIQPTGCVCSAPAAPFTLSLGNCATW